MSETPPARVNGRPASVRARRSAIDHIADHENRDRPGLLEEPTTDAASIPLSTFSVVPQTMPSTIDEDLIEDDDVVASEVRPEEVGSAALEEVRAPAIEPESTPPVVVATIDSDEPRTVDATGALQASRKRPPAAGKSSAPRRPAASHASAAEGAPGGTESSSGSTTPVETEPIQEAAKTPPGVKASTPQTKKAPRKKASPTKRATPTKAAPEKSGSERPTTKAPGGPPAKTERKPAATAASVTAAEPAAPAKTVEQKTTSPKSATGSSSTAKRRTTTVRPGPPETDAARVPGPSAAGPRAGAAADDGPALDIDAAGVDAAPRLDIASSTIVVDLPPDGRQEVPEDELAVAIEEEPVMIDGIDTRTSSVAVAEPAGAADRDDPVDESTTASSTPEFTGMSVARALAGAPESASMLTAERLLDDRTESGRVPEGFWQKLLFDVSGRRIRVADSKAARARIALTARIAKPLVGSARFVPVLTRKGGVGKTTVTALLGMALADARDDRIIAIDANPDRGTLAERIARRSDHTVRDLVRRADEISGYTEFSNLVSRDETRLDVLASDTDPHLSHAFDDEDYGVVAKLASQYYSIVLTDCGTGIVHSVMRATLGHADTIVIVSGTSVDEARSAAETVSWLEANGYPELASNAVVVINSTAPATPAVRLDEIEKHFESRVRSIVRIPYDPQLATGAAISFAALRPDTRRAARELSALVVEGLPLRRPTRERADG